MKPWTEKAQSKFQPGDRLIEYLSGVVIISGIMLLSVGVLIFALGLPRIVSGAYDRSAFVIVEGSPLFLFAFAFFIAAFGIYRLQLWAWQLGLLGSIGAVAYGVYRFYPSSSLGALFTMVFGAVNLVLLCGSLRSFRRQMSEQREGAQST